ncbi:MAG: hypothetical protein ACRDHN_08170 [Thermomicrobiales bacterium]
MTTPQAPVNLGIGTKSKRKADALTLVMPLLPGRINDARVFLWELETISKTEFQRAGQRLGIDAAHWHLVEIAGSDLLLVNLLGTNLSFSLRRLSTSELPFDTWLRERLSLLTGTHENDPFPSEWRTEPDAGYRLGTTLTERDWLRG